MPPLEVVGSALEVVALPSASSSPAGKLPGSIGEGQQPPVPPEAADAQNPPAGAAPEANFDMMRGDMPPQLPGAPAPPAVPAAASAVPVAGGPQQLQAPNLGATTWSGSPVAWAGPREAGSAEQDRQDQPRSFE